MIYLLGAALVLLYIVVILVDLYLLFVMGFLLFDAIYLHKLENKKTRTKLRIVSGGKAKL